MRRLTLSLCAASAILIAGALVLTGGPRPAASRAVPAAPIGPRSVPATPGQAVPVAAPPGLHSLLLSQLHRLAGGLQPSLAPRRISPGPVRPPRGLPGPAAGAPCYAAAGACSLIPCAVYAGSGQPLAAAATSATISASVLAGPGAGVRLGSPRLGSPRLGSPRLRNSAGACLTRPGAPRHTLRVSITGY